MLHSKFTTEYNPLYMKKENQTDDCRTPMRMKQYFSGALHFASLLFITLFLVFSGKNVQAQCSTDPDCTDGNACNGVEICQDGTCIPGIPPPPCIDDGDACNGPETCDPA